MHNCSGKHAGMLALCHASDWPYEGYRLTEHPCQQAMLAEVAELAETTELATAVDGCGVVTFALPLERMAAAFTRVDERIAAAMRAYPELIRGHGALDTSLMEELPGWTAKGGAEGLLCAAGPDGLGLALKAEDGQQRALHPALGAFLEMLGLDGSGFGTVPIYNSRREVVGSVTSC
jgi:L-asparaginase II